jgi:hypothetical protein
MTTELPDHGGDAPVFHFVVHPAFPQTVPLPESSRHNAEGCLTRFSALIARPMGQRTLSSSSSMNPSRIHVLNNSSRFLVLPIMQIWRAFVP